MTTRKRFGTGGVAVLLAVLTWGGGSALAGVWNGVATGLGAAGFDIRGGHNVLSGGSDVLVTNTFQGQKFDFGALELTLNGPLSLDFSTGGRLLPGVDVALTTAASSDVNATPLSYNLNFDVGGQQTSITGTLLIDGAVSLNRLGWYELNIDTSSRQTVVNDGRFDNGQKNFDFDVGPINVRGNIFADMLAAVTDPFFKAANTENIFAGFSGQARLKEVLTARVEEAVTGFAGDVNAPSRTAQGLSPFAELFVLGPNDPSTVEVRPSDRQLAEVGAFDQTNAARSPIHPASGRFTTPAPAGVVPEPSVLLLMLLTVPAILFRRRRSVSQ